MLGDEVDVPTLSGRARLKIEPGTEPGRVLRMRGKGLPALNGYRTGDQTGGDPGGGAEETLLAGKRTAERTEGFRQLQAARSADKGFFKKTREAFGT